MLDIIIHSASQVVTCAGGNAGAASHGGFAARRGRAMRDVNLIPNGAVAISDGVIVAVDSTENIRAEYTARDEIDASGRVVCPGFVDAHTHLVFAGERVDEFELRIQGATYMEIMQAGGGIASSMRATRAASLAELVAQARRPLDEMLRLGTTTVEVKTGYGLDTASELKLLQAIVELDKSHPVDLVPTFLGAHALPPEFKGRTDDYVDLVVNEMLPAVRRWADTAALDVPLFCDVFCEENVFDVEQARRVLQAGLETGLAPKIHADEFVNLGGVALAVELGAVSADHLDVTSAAEVTALAGSDVVGVLLPAVNFNFGSAHYADARRMLDEGVVVALATDFNPGSAPCLSMPLVMAIACRYQKLTPAEALNASTINAAHALGLGQRVGSLEPGKQADLLLLNVPDYRHLAYQFGGNLVERVFKRGKQVA